jgi:RND family efflux transporter, MFP subunit
MAKSRSFGGTLITLVCIAAAAGGAYYFWKRGDVKPPEVSVATVTRGDIIQTITATGILQSPTSVDVSSQISGQIIEVNADYNQKVTKGDVLARIDPATYESRLRQARASLASTEASNRLVRQNTERTRELRARNLVSQQELDQAEAQLAQSEAQLLTAQASVEDAIVNLNRCTIYAPIDGIVLDRQTEVGKMVAASLNAPTLFTLVTDLTKMEISADVAEADIGAVAVGQEVTFTVDAHPNRQFRGRVSQIRNLPKTAQSVVVYATIIEVDNRDLRLKPGMTANVSIITARRDNVLKIANAALRARVPDQFLPPAPAGNNAAGAPQPATREQMRQLMQDAGVTFTPGTPLDAASIEKLKALAAERGLELPERMLSGGRRNRDDSGNEPVITTRTVYRQLSPLPDLKIEPVQARFGITDGSSTEVVDGLQEGDTIITSIYVPNASSSAANQPNRNPFGGGGPGGFRR